MDNEPSRRQAPLKLIGRALSSNSRGQTIAEYGLIVAAVVIVLAVAMGPDWMDDNIAAVVSQIHQIFSGLN